MAKTTALGRTSLRHIPPDAAAWVVETWDALTCAEQVGGLSERFDVETSVSAVLAWGKRHVGRPKSKGRLDWSGHPEWDAWLRANAEGHSYTETCAAFEAEFGVEVPPGKLGHHMSLIGIRAGVNAGRFKKGDPRSGIKSEAHRRAFIEAGRRTRLERGGTNPWNQRNPVGTERDFCGYTYVKVAMRKKSEHSSHDNWVGKHVLEWERANGRKLPEGRVVLFADRDRTNFAPDNLVAVTRAELAVINHMGAGYHDRESLEACIALARLRTATRAATMRQRECKACGSRFTPRFDSQRRCDDCIAARRRK